MAIFCFFLEDLVLCWVGSWLILLKQQHFTDAVRPQKTQKAAACDPWDARRASSSRGDDPSHVRRGTHETKNLLAEDEVSPWRLAFGWKLTGKNKTTQTQVVYGKGDFRCAVLFVKGACFTLSLGTLEGVSPQRTHVLPCVVEQTTREVHLDHPVAFKTN